MIDLAQSEIDSWLLLLAPTLSERIKVLGDLLKYADEDRMAPEDRDIVQSSLTKLVSEYDERFRRDRGVA